MKKEVEFNLIGTIPIPRIIFTLVNQNTITMSELSWYILFISQAEFGHKYTKIGIITAGDKIIAKELNCDPTTVNKKRNKLIKLGLLKTHPEGTEITNYEMFTPNKKSGVVPITTSVIREEGQKNASELFQNKEQFLKKRQEIIENQRQHLVQNL